MIGFFVNTLPIRIDLSGSPTVSELLVRVKAQALAAQQHQALPFEQMVEAVKPQRSPGLYACVPGDVRLGEHAQPRVRASRVAGRIDRRAAGHCAARPPLMASRQ